MNTLASNAPSQLSVGKPLRIGLWAAQGVLFVAFVMSGFMKLTTPIPQLSAMMPWTGQFSETFVRFICPSIWPAVSVSCCRL